MSTEPPDSSVPPSPPAVIAGWTAADRAFLRAMGLVAAVLIGLNWLMMSDLVSPPVAVTSLGGRATPFVVEINSASWIEWAQLEGVGERLARRIVEYRDTHGSFRSIDELTNVQGIGRKTVENLRASLRVDLPVHRPVE